MKENFKCFCITFLITLAPFMALSQSKEASYGKIRDYILHNYRPDSSSVAKCCSNGCIYIKFRVDRRGEITDVSLSGNTDSVTFIKNALLFSVQMLRQDSQLNEFLKQSGKTIIQPFMFDYRTGCKVPESGAGGSSRYYLSYIKILSRLAQNSYTSMHNMLKFDGKRSMYIDGVILEPIEVNNIVMY